MYVVLSLSRDLFVFVGVESVCVFVYIQDIFAMNLPVSLARFYVLLLIY